MPKAVKKIIAPVLVIHGSKDTSVPLKQSQDLIDCLKVKKKLYIIDGAPHTINDENHLKSYASKIETWLKQNFL